MQLFQTMWKCALSQSQWLPASSSSSSVGLIALEDFSMKVIGGKTASNKYNNKKVMMLFKHRRKSPILFFKQFQVLPTEISGHTLYVSSPSSNVSSRNKFMQFLLIISYKRNCGPLISFLEKVIVRWEQRRTGLQTD